jgi:hypothetical protein
MEFSSIDDFYKVNIQGKPWTISIVGNKSQINLEELKKYGKVKEIEAEVLFKK